MDYVDASCGILIEPAGPDAIVSGFVDAIRKLAADPALRVQLGTVGRKRAGLLYDWNLKIDRIVEIYRQCIFDRRS
jgi:glycosyltransferase involved in cell wall biosynthesis